MSGNNYVMKPGQIAKNYVKEIGQNPANFVMKLLGNNTNPMMNNLINMAQKGDTQGVKSVAENICKERDINFDEEFNASTCFFDLQPLYRSNILRLWVQQ